MNGAPVKPHALVWRASDGVWFCEGAHPSPCPRLGDQAMPEGSPLAVVNHRWLVCVDCAREVYGETPPEGIELTRLEPGEAW